MVQIHQDLPIQSTGLLAFSQCSLHSRIYGVRLQIYPLGGEFDVHEKTKAS